MSFSTYFLRFQWPKVAKGNTQRRPDKTRSGNVKAGLSLSQVARSFDNASSNAGELG
jgi:hypothetical protein